MNNTTTLITAIIPAGTALSAPVNLTTAQDTSGRVAADRRLFGVFCPSGWTAANLTFQISPDSGTTWYDLYDNNGNEIFVPVIAGKAYSLSITDLAGVTMFRCRSGTSASPVNQASDATLTYIVRPV